MTISFIIPNYNGKKLLHDNLPHIIREAKLLGSSFKEIVIIDDCSTDGSFEWIQSYITTNNLHHLVKVYQTGKNAGFSSTMNIGASKSTGELLVFLNSDVEPDDHFLKFVLPHFDDTKLFGVGLLDKSIENGTIVERGNGYGWWQNGMYFHKKGSNKSTQTSWISGGSCVVRKKYFIEIGGFNQLYDPFYWEDIDLSYRAVHAGYNILFEPNASVTHRHSVGAIKSTYSGETIKRISYRNQFLFIFCNATIFQLLTHWINMPIVLLKAIKHMNWLLVRGYLEALYVFNVHFYHGLSFRKVKSIFN